MQKQRGKINPAILVIIILTLLAIGVGISKNSQKNEATIQNGHITRNCEQLLKVLDQEPEDITAQPYVENVPKQIQQDIDTMLNAEEELDICYMADEKELINIQKDIDNPSKIVVTMNRISKGEYYVTRSYFLEKISFYRNGEDIVVYGSEFRNCRRITRMAANAKTGEYVWDAFWADSIDLFGVDTGENHQGMRQFNKNMTLLVKDNIFSFYQDGKQVGEPVPFPGGVIQKMDYYYVLGEGNSLYYLYYCDNPQNPWIRFEKIDDGVTVVEESFVSSFDSNVRYPIYWKENKFYAGISSMELEKAYGQNYGRNQEPVSPDELDFTITVLELSAETAEKVILKTEKTGNYWNSGEYDWYLRYCYEVNGESVYEEKRINGLDSYLSRRIPENLAEKYEGMEILPEQVDQIIAELKEMYASYEKMDEFYAEEPPDGGSSDVKNTIQ